MEDKEKPNEGKFNMEDLTLVQKLLEFAIKHSGKIKYSAIGLLLIAIVATLILALFNQKAYLAVFAVAFGLVGAVLIFVFQEIVRNARIKSILDITIQAQVIFWIVILVFGILVVPTAGAMVSLIFFCKPTPLRIILDIKCDESPSPTLTPTPSETPKLAPLIKITFPQKGIVAARKDNPEGDLLNVAGTVENIDLDMKWRVCILDQSSSNEVMGKGFLQGECFSIKNKDWKTTISLGHKGALLPRNNGEVDTKSYNIMAILLDEKGFNTFSSRCPSKDKEQNCDWEKPKEAIATDEVNIAAYVPK